MPLLPFSLYGSRIKSFLEGKTDKEEREVEVRFQPFAYQGKKQSFLLPSLRLRDYLANFPKEELMLRDTNYTERSNVNEHSTFRISQKDGVDTYINKVSKSEKIKNYPLVFSLAQEIKVEAIPKYLLSQEGYVRVKKRTSYLLPYAQVDITIVDPIDLSSKRTEGTKYEIEVECTNKNKVNEFCNFIDDIYNIVYDTEIAYTEEERNSLYDFLYNKFGTERTENIINRPQDVKYFFLSYGQVVKEEKDKSYYLTYKSDGLHKFVIAINSNLWIMFGDEVSLIYKGDLFKNYEPALLEGEKMDLSDGYFMQLYDCLIIKGKDIRNANFKDRLTFVERFITTGKDMGFQTKRIESLSVDNFFPKVKEFLNGRQSLEYKEDGLIFISGGVYKEPIYKWKDPKDLTIDFRVSATHKGFYLTTADGSNFAPDGQPFTVESKEIEDGQIGEFEYNPVLKTFKLRKIRYDKLYPNKKEVALSVWKSLMNPILEEHLTGQSLKLVFKYHNRLKEKLWSKVNKNTTILDIGTGRGGDLSKMGSDKILYAVEPNKDNLNELIRRSKTGDELKAIYPIEAGGEEYNKITAVVKEKVDVIAFMLSLTFFWQSKEKVDALMKTIEQTAKDDCQIIFMVADGLKMKEYITSKGGKATFPGGTKMRLEGQTVKIHIPDSIVTDQTEYLYDHQDFVRRLRALGFKELEGGVADGEKLLTKEQMTFSSLYRWGVFKRTNQLSRRKVTEKPLGMITPNKVEVLVNDWIYEGEMVRIGCIPEGSCFVHAFLTSLSPSYRALTSRPAREEKAKQFRQELSLYLQEKKDGYARWETIRDGMFPKSAMKYLTIGDKDNNYLFDNAISFLDSRQWLGEDTIAMIGELFKVDIYIVQACPDNVYPYIAYKHKDIVCPKIIINYTGSHYETVGLLKDKEVFTYFKADNPLIIYLNKQIEGTYIDEKKFDVSAMYKESLDTIFITEDKGIMSFKVPDAYYQVNKEDILRKRLDPLITAKKQTQHIKSPRLQRS
jgi:hypothetical protein